MRKIVGNGVSDFGEFKNTVFKQLGDAMLTDRALGEGTTRPGTLAGKRKAVYVEVNLTNVPDLNAVNVGHRLGSKPTICELVEARNSAGAVFPTAQPAQKHKWTVTNCRMAVSLNGGVQAGTVLKFRVGGE